MEAWQSKALSFCFSYRSYFIMQPNQHTEQGVFSWRCLHFSWERTRKVSSKDILSCIHFPRSLTANKSLRTPLVALYLWGLYWQVTFLSLFSVINNELVSSEIKEGLVLPYNGNPTRSMAHCNAPLSPSLIEHRRATSGSGTFSPGPGREALRGWVSQAPTANMWQSWISAEARPVYYTSILFPFAPWKTQLLSWSVFRTSGDCNRTQCSPDPCSGSTRGRPSEIHSPHLRTKALLRSIPE